MTESELQQKIHATIGARPDVRLFRNHVGMVVDKSGRTHTFGLRPGSADLIGWQSIRITPEMVGETVAVFVSLEIKTATGRVRPEQENWRAVVAKFGGRAGIVRSIADALEVLA